MHTVVFHRFPLSSSLAIFSFSFSINKIDSHNQALDEVAMIDRHTHCENPIGRTSRCIWHRLAAPRRPIGHFEGVGGLNPILAHNQQYSTRPPSASHTLHITVREKRKMTMRGPFREPCFYRPSLLESSIVAVPF